jgi:hypothetical protein
LIIRCIALQLLCLPFLVKRMFLELLTFKMISRFC